MIESLEKILEKIKNCNNVAIFGHVNTDGDCLGSMCALYSYLINNNKSADIFVDSVVPENYKTIPHIEIVNSKVFDIVEYDLLVSIDCSTPERLGEYADTFLNFENTILIDHHIKTTDNYAKFSYVEEKTSSCGEVLFNVLNKISKIDKDCATCLYSAILSDTNQFSNDNVTSLTFKTVAKLLDFGADFSNVNYYTQKLKTKNQEKLLGFMASHLKFVDNIAILVVKKKHLKKFGVKSSDVSKFMQQITDVENIKITILIKQKSFKKYSLSFRSLPNYNVANVAGKFNGGGHINAAGGRFDGCLFNLKKLLIKFSKQEIVRVDNA